ncbi:MAG: Eco57I restriction-modification methylase domain-containing protein [Gemmataceae bacterium]
MPTEAKPLFRPDAMRPALSNFTLPPAAVAARPKIVNWATLLASTKADAFKETELLPDFLTDLFVYLLGYVGPASGSDAYTLKREATVEVDGKFADAVIGRFSSAGAAPAFVAAIEGKGPRDPLDRPFAGRKYSAVDQALHYAVNLPCDWYIVTNFRELRLFHKGHDQHTFEQFETSALALDDNALRKFVFLLGAQRVLPADRRCHLDILLDVSRKIGQELTVNYYREYSDLRRAMFTALRNGNPGVPAPQLLAATQKILDRVLFVAFCEDRGLLPTDSVAGAFRHTDPYNPRPIWDNFRGLFRAINEGNPRLDIARYNGGLFADDELLDRLNVPDTICAGFDKLAAYEYRPATLADDITEDGAGKIIDVEILGHIFEQSISDLEELHQQLAGGPAPDAKQSPPTKRKREGAFYTPSFVTRYIVAETLRPVLAERFESLRQQHEGDAPAAVRKVLADPSAYDLAELKPAQKKALAQFWEAWQDVLAAVRIVDPACGSGAFLIQAFEQLHDVYRQLNARLKDLRGQETLFDVDQQILQQNLFGVDLNPEAVDICRLSLWIKTAQVGKVLTSLDHNIRVGNSVIADKAVHPDAFDWRAGFPEVFTAGGFDVVICNPPYIRQEWISQFKPYLQQHYRAYDSVADLYVYFYELGLNLLKPGGRLGFIVTNKWLKAGYGEALRRLFAESAWVDSVIDFGHAKQIFPDADVFPSILVARKPDPSAAPETARVCSIPRELLRIDDLSRQIQAEGIAVPRNRLGAEPWNLESPGVVTLLEKIRRAGTPLKAYAKCVPLYGIKTGLTEAFVLNNSTRQALVSADPKAAELLKPFLRGQDIDRWRGEWSGHWMLAIRSSSNHEWPWSRAESQAESVFAATYPSVHAHLNKQRTALIKRQDQGEFWWELRACAYWSKFDQPKIIFPDLTWRSSFCRDDLGSLIGDTAFMLPISDLWALAVLNSPAMWAWLWRNTLHGKDDVLRLKTIYTETLPIPIPDTKTHSTVITAVERLLGLSQSQHEGRGILLDWLRAEFAVEKASQKLQNVAALDADTLIAEVKKARGKTKSLTAAGVKLLKDEYARTVAPLQTLAAEALQLERRVSDLVNAAYGLTPEEVALMWQTAPPRMPIT